MNETHLDFVADNIIKSEQNIEKIKNELEKKGFDIVTIEDYENMVKQFLNINDLERILDLPLTQINSSKSLITLKEEESMLRKKKDYNEKINKINTYIYLSNYRYIKQFGKTGEELVKKCPKFTELYSQIEQSWNLNKELDRYSDQDRKIIIDKYNQKKDEELERMLK